MIATRRFYFLALRALTGRLREALTALAMPLIDLSRRPT
jgi:hypothetical protein